MSRYRMGLGLFLAGLFLLAGVRPARAGFDYPLSFLPVRTSVEMNIVDAYRGILGRDPLPEEYQLWRKIFVSGINRWVLVENLLDGHEYHEHIAAETYTLIAFRKLLNRQPSPREFSALAAALESGAAYSHLLRALRRNPQFRIPVAHPTDQPAVFGFDYRPASFPGWEAQVENLRRGEGPVIAAENEVSLQKMQGLPFESSGKILSEMALVSPVYKTRGVMNHYRGYLHAHTSVSFDADETGFPDLAFHSARDQAGMDFMSLTDHGEYISPKEWAAEKVIRERYDQPGRFVALLGFEWSSPIYGHICVVGTPEYTGFLETADLPQFYDWLSARPGAVATFNHPGSYDYIGQEFHHFRYDNRLDDILVGIEVIQNHGFEEYATGYDGETTFFDLALRAGWHVGALSAQDNHSKDWGVKNDVRTVVLAPELTLEAIMDGYRARRFYATEDKTLEVTFECLGYPMGSRLVAGKKEFTVSVRDPEGEVFQEVLLLKNGVEEASVVPNASEGTWSFTIRADADPAYYYVFVAQEDGDRAITSPIWVAGGRPSDAQAPTTMIEAPADGAHVSGPYVVISGTSLDNSGGTGVALVEVSTDGGQSWQAAEGTARWVYRWQPQGSGANTLVARSRDFNDNIERQPPRVGVTVQAISPDTQVLAAGYASTRITATEGGRVSLQAYVDDPAVTEMALYYGGVPLLTFGRGGDGTFLWQTSLGAAASGRYLLEAAPLAGGIQGLSWPYLTVMP